MGQPLVTVDARVSERRIFVTPEGEYGLVHMLGIEHLEPHEQMEILHRQPGHGQEQIGVNPGDDILQCVLTEIGEIHERRNARRELDELSSPEMCLHW